MTLDVLTPPEPRPLPAERAEARHHHLTAQIGRRRTTAARVRGLWESLPNARRVVLALALVGVLATATAAVGVQVQRGSSDDLFGPDDLVVTVGDRSLYAWRGTFAACYEIVGPEDHRLQGCGGIRGAPPPGRGKPRPTRDITFAMSGGYNRPTLISGMVSDRVARVAVVFDGGRVVEPELYAPRPEQTTIRMFRFFFFDSPVARPSVGPMPPDFGIRSLRAYGGDGRLLDRHDFPPPR